MVNFDTSLNLPVVTERYPTNHGIPMTLFVRQTMSTSLTLKINSLILNRIIGATADLKAYF